MSSAGKIKKLWIRDFKPQKRINIILKDSMDNIIYTETVDYNEKTYKSCFDIARYICDKFNYKQGLYCEYDETTKSNYTYYDAIANEGYINWRINFSRIDVGEAFKGEVDNSITVKMENISYGLGNSGGISILGALDWIIKLAKLVCWIIRYIVAAITPYAKMEKTFHKDKDFIKRTILLGNNWRCGFISTEEFEFKRTIEKCIMKKLGYKKQEKKWIKVNE